MAKNTMLLYGKNSVLERLKANPQSIRKILLQENFDTPHIEKLIKAHNVPVERLPFRKLTRVKPAKDLQGIIAWVDKFKYVSFSDLLSPVESNQLTLILLDRINDPQNLGVIIRTAACFGRFAVVIPQFNACGVTEAVLHVACGGENHVSVSLVPNLSHAVLLAKKYGYWIVGAVVNSEAEYINKTSLPFPLGLVLGSEGKGIRYGLQKHLDLKARIPMQGAELSFNVAIASAVFCYEVSKQRGISK